MDYKILEMNNDYAQEILNWHYEKPYSIYDLDKEDESNLEELLNNSYYVLIDENNNLIGFYCIGLSAQVPYGHNFNVYDEPNYVDIGLGMNPKYCGKGRGYEFFELGLNFFKKKYNTNLFRLTVFDFNKRAINLYHKSGFVIKNYFKANNNHYFLVMTLDR